jgi:uncharacterized membrane protein YkvA (DUF1232 family)
MVTKRLRGLNFDLVALLYALKDPRTPILPKLIAAAMAIYVFSPVDFLPDLMPLLGIVDDALVIPTGTSLALNSLPDDVFASSRAQSRKRGNVVRYALIGAGILAFVGVGLLLRTWPQAPT